MAGAASTALTTRFSSGLFLSLSTLASLALSAGASEHLAIQQASFYLLATGCGVAVTGPLWSSVSFFVSRISYIIYSIGKRERAWQSAAAASACEPRKGQRAFSFLPSLLAALHYYQST